MGLRTGSFGRVPAELIPLHFLGLALSVLGAVAAGRSLRCAACHLRLVVPSNQPVGRRS
jgi:hypothetical protein